MKIDPIKFWSLVNKTDSCWLWTGRLYPAGYGAYSVGKEERAHRISYMLVKGQISEGLELDHLCRVRNCVNPEHLEAVTHKENMRRGEAVSAKNSRKTHCDTGHPLSGENLQINIRGHRICRICRDRRQNKWRAKLKSTSH